MSLQNARRGFNSTDSTGQSRSEQGTNLAKVSTNLRKVLRETEGSHIRAALQQAAAALASAGIDAPHLCAELLLAHVLNCDRLKLLTNPSQVLSTDQAERLQNLIQRRLAHEPVQHLIGCTEFWSLPILCDRRALIPRPETELLVEAALDLARAMASTHSAGPAASRHCDPADGGAGNLSESIRQVSQPGMLAGCAPKDCHVVSPFDDAQGGIPRNDTHNAESPLLIADIGTGTGCVAIALASELPQARIIATDISADALALAAENITNAECRVQNAECRSDGTNSVRVAKSQFSNQNSVIANRPSPPPLAQRVILRRGDLLAPLAADGPGAFDLIVSNPPYIPDAAMEALQPEVRAHDPELALRGGPEGCTIINRLLREALLPLRPGGCLVLEIGVGEAELVKRNAAAGGWKLLRSLRDGADIERIIALQKER